MRWLRGSYGEQNVAMPTNPVLTRAQVLWEGLAAAPVSFSPQLFATGGRRVVPDVPPQCARLGVTKFG